jgi:hypothetical protein
MNRRSLKRRPKGEHGHEIARQPVAELHKEETQVIKVLVGVEIKLGGQKYFITAKRQQILDSLISTY